jgi:hypothetical protein
MSANREMEDRSERLWQEEDAMLIAAGFKPMHRVNSRLWVKGDGVYYGREAALQAVKRNQREGGA